MSKAPEDTAAASPEDSGSAEPGQPDHAGQPPAPVPLLTLRDGLPQVIESAAALSEYCAALAAGSGPVAVDAERASGYRYSNRAYLVQLRREGAGSALIDPIAFDAATELTELVEALDGTEWILHAASQDLVCLAEIGLRPSRLFDTELAGRLLGKPRVGLATLVEEVVGLRLRKEHSAADWSTRPLPQSWLEYAALDVEVLIELRAAMVDELEAAGKTEWARQEFEALLEFTPTVRVEPWRRTSGAHKVRGRRPQGAVRELWETRNTIGQDTDTAPGRIVGDAALVAAASAMPHNRSELMAVSGFHGRGASRYAKQWLAALDRARTMPERDLPGRPTPSDGPPPVRSWTDRDPVAARRLAHARAATSKLAEELVLPIENLLTPDSLRRVLWTPPATRDPAELTAAVAEQLRGYAAREWQIDLIAGLIVAAILAGDEPEPEPELEPEPDAD